MTYGEEILKQERLDEQKRKDKPLTTDCLYDANGEPISDEEWDRRLNEEQ